MESSFNLNDRNDAESDNDKELIYDKTLKLQDYDKLFEDNDEGPVVYEIDVTVDFLKGENSEGKDSREVIRSEIVRVELEKLSYEKPMLGGFVNKSSGVYYFHAYGQTNQYENEYTTKFHKDTQTHIVTTKSTMPKREFGTQMERIGLYIDNRNDKVQYATNYCDAETWERNKERIVMFMQKMAKGYLARTKANKEKEKLKQKKDAEKKELNEKRDKEQKDNLAEIERRNHPKNAKDFQLLRKELDAWVTQETEKIKSSKLNETEQKLALQELLHKEISLLETIERLKISAKKENSDGKIKDRLSKMSRDKEYLRHDGRYVSVSTVFTRTAEILKAQFTNLSSSSSVDIRLKNLLEFKQLMEQYYYFCTEEKHMDCTLIEEIIALIEREADMLTRGRPVSSLEGLRKRLNTLYMNFIEIPDFNYEAANFQILPRNWLMNLYKKKKRNDDGGKYKGSTKQLPDDAMKNNKNFNIKNLLKEEN